MAYRFNMDIQELRRLMGWIEWRCDVLKDHPQLPLMVQVVRGDVDGYHDLFGSNPFQHSMLQDAQVFGHRLLKGVGDSICSNPQETFVASCHDKVGKELEGVLYLGFCESYNCLVFTMELFFLCRDVRNAFLLCQKYGFGSDREYDLTALRASVLKMEHMLLGLGPHRCHGM